MPAKRLTAIVLGLVAAVAACDRMPSDPALDPDLDAALVAAETAAGTTAPYTLPDLLRQAITKTHTELGREAARDVTRNWLGLNELAREAIRAADRQSAYARLTEVHEEELQIVLNVFGTRVVSDVVGAIEAGVATARQELREAKTAGKDVARSANLIDDIKTDLAEAKAAEAGGENAVALDRATTAAVTLSAVRSFIGWLNRVDGLEVLFPEAVARLERNSESSAQHVRSSLDRLTWNMQSALSAGDHASARRASEQIRAEQIATVLRVFGTGRVRELTAAIGSTIDSSRVRLDQIESAGRDVGRYRRMLREASSLYERAAAALAAGDAATALDLASHAAGLVNAVGQI